MIRDEVESILSKILETEEMQLDFPSNEDWNAIGSKFNSTTF